MSVEGLLLFSEHYADIDRRIDAKLAAYKPDLSQATGELSSTRYPTPTGNAPGGYTPSAHTHSASDITSGTMATARLGSGTASSSTFLRGDSTWATISGTGTVTSINITAPAAGITATGGPITTSGSITLALADDLAALEGLSSTGLAARTASNTWAQRTITGTSARIAVTNGGGVAGNPTIDIDTGYVGQASITTLGTIATGTWQGTKIGLAYGGTNADLSATGGAGQYLKQASAGAAITVGTIPYTDLTYSGLTTGQVLRATSATATAFGAMDLANSSAVTGILPSGNGGTGVNNGGRTLTITNNNIEFINTFGSAVQVTLAATGTVPIYNTLTASGGRLTYWETGGKIGGDANLTWNSGSAILTITGSARIQGVDIGLSPSSDFVIRHGTSSTGTILRISPNGNGITNPASFQMFNTDWNASQTNFELFTCGWNTNVVSFLSQAGGTGTIRDILFSITSGANMRLTAGGNVGIFGTSFGASSVGVIAIANRTTAPTGNPTGGGVLYAASGAGTWRGSSGTITSFGPAGPHCEACGYDAWAVAMRNDAWQAYCYICGHCGARYAVGPQSVLGLLRPEERQQIIRQGMSYEALNAVLE